jgi:hypothetical protein
MLVASSVGPRNCGDDRATFGPQGLVVEAAERELPAGAIRQRQELRKTMIM